MSDKKFESPLGTPEWTPEQWEAFDKAETAKETTWDDSARIVRENGWTVGGESSTPTIKPESDHRSINEQIDGKETDDE